MSSLFNQTCLNEGQLPNQQHTHTHTHTHTYIYIYIYIYVCVLYSHLHVHAASQRHNDKDAKRKTQEDFFNNILPLTLLQRFERVVQGLHVRGSWRPNINCNILTPLL